MQQKKKHYGYSSDVVDVAKSASLTGQWAAIAVVVFILITGYVTLKWDRFAKPFAAETSYITNKQSSAARDGAINRLTTLKENWERQSADPGLQEGIAMNAVREYNGMAHKDDVPDYIVQWLEKIQPGISK